MKAILLLALLIALATGSGPLFILAAAGLGIRTSLGYWQRRVRVSLTASRRFERRIFFGDSLTVELRVRNGSALPVPWLLVRDNAPYTLAGSNVLSQVIALRGLETREIRYELRGLQRGYQPIGPLRLSLGNVLGFESQELEVRGRQHLLVYPRLLPYHALQLPSQTLQGERPIRRHFHGDPSRVVGVRDYLPGDPYRDIHWRATATAGSLQVKLYQPTTELRTMIFLDHRSTSFSIRRAGNAEVAVSVAASIAAFMVERQQEVGLVTNGLVRLAPDEAPASGPVKHDAMVVPVDFWLSPPTSAAGPIAPGKGRAHLHRILEVLACLKLHDGAEPLAGLLLRHSADMAWGATAVAISGEPSDDLFMALHRARERGIVVILYLAGRRPDVDALQARGRAVGVQVRCVSEHHLGEVAL
jgi:uncharacterized protein (DUF58 family)